MYACPTCGDGSNAATTCLRCGVELRSVAGSVEIPGPMDVPGTGHSFGRIAAALGTVVAMPILTWLLMSSLAPVPHAFFRQNAQITAAITFGGPLLLLALALLSHLVIASRDARRRRSISTQARGRANELIATSPTMIQGRARKPVRIRGVVAVVEGLLHVTDGASRVRVPLTTGVRVFDGDVLQHVLSTGQEVEVVGVGARKLGSGDGYRDVHGEFVFDASEPIDVFVC